MHFGSRIAYSFSGVLGDILFVADSAHDAIYTSALTTSDTSLSLLPFKNLTFPIGIDLDPFETRLYWTDQSRGTVARSSLNGKDQEIIRSGVARPYGLALDLVARNVYWINRDNLTIEVSKLNGEYWKVLVSNLSSQPYDIALDTHKG